MKKTLVPAILVLALAVGGYFMFLYEPGEKGDSEGQEQVEADSNAVALPAQPTPEDLRRQQRLDEHARPNDFIATNFKSRRNLLGEAIIEGSFTNNAELTIYQDFQVMIYFEDELGNVADSASQVVFETIKPGEMVEFRLKEKQPKRTEVRLKVLEAKTQDVPKKPKSVGDA